jgi:hypothetical protein
LAGEIEVRGENLPQCKFCPPQIPHYLTWAQTQAVAMGSQLLTTCAMPDITSMSNHTVGLNQFSLSANFRNLSLLQLHSNCHNNFFLPPHPLAHSAFFSKETYRNSIPWVNVPKSEALFV